MCVCECVIENRRQREEGHSVPLCEEKRGHAIVCCCVSGQCAEVIHSALTYSCRRSALCSKPHTPQRNRLCFPTHFSGWENTLMKKDEAIAAHSVFAAAPVTQ